ncbi:MAG TPA: hypothetical protein VJT73_09745, partial [Polyangiaceae bacterium]|nr:hypothetical protein [Polyangiaceae bacterium]
SAHVIIEGLTSAKIHAQIRSCSSPRPVVVVEVQANREVARFLPGGAIAAERTLGERRPTPQPPPVENPGSTAEATGDKRPNSEALLRLRKANQRLQEIVHQVPERKDKPAG